MDDLYFVVEPGESGESDVIDSSNAVFVNMGE